MVVEGVELRRVGLPLVRPFVTSAGAQLTRDALVVRILAGDGEGWGECVAMAAPGYTSEYVGGAEYVLRHHLLPRLFSAGEVEAESLGALFAAVQGLTEPFVPEHGRLRVPTGPGLGVTPLPDALADLTTSVELLRP